VTTLYGEPFRLIFSGRFLPSPSVVCERGKGEKVGFIFKDTGGANP